MARSLRGGANGCDSVGRLRAGYGRWGGGGATGGFAAVGDPEPPPQPSSIPTARTSQVAAASRPYLNSIKNTPEEGSIGIRGLFFQKGQQVEGADQADDGVPFGYHDVVIGVLPHQTGSLPAVCLR